jgi:light-harvesting protein B-800-850 alpha chain
MNQGRIWCVVQPTIGLPLFLGSVALMSFTVHFAVLNNSSWMKDFFNGVPLKSASVEEVTTPAADVATNAKPAFAAERAPTSAFIVDDQATLVVKVKPKNKTPDPHVITPG